MLQCDGSAATLPNGCSTRRARTRRPAARGLRLHDTLGRRRTKAAIPALPSRGTKTMNSLADDFAKGIFRSPEPPCLSLYQPTHRSHPESAQNPIRFGNLVKSLEESLRQKYPKRDIESLLKPFRQLAGDRDFWATPRAGIAVLVSPSLTRIYKLERSVPELAIVADSFHIKPLLRMVQSAD